MANRYVVSRILSDGHHTTDYVVAWDFNILPGGVLVFNDRMRKAAYRDWVSVKQES